MEPEWFKANRKRLISIFIIIFVFHDVALNTAYLFVPGDLAPKTGTFAAEFLVFEARARNFGVGGLWHVFSNPLKRHASLEIVETSGPAPRNLPVIAEKFEVGAVDRLLGYNPELLHLFVVSYAQVRETYRMNWTHPTSAFVRYANLVCDDRTWNADAKALRFDFVTSVSSPPEGDGNAKPVDQFSPEWKCP